MEKKKTYVLILSEKFPKTHKRAGEPTHFKDKFLLGQGCLDCTEPQDLTGENISMCNGCICACMLPKLHTIRANYPLWQKRIKEIQEGHAVLSIRQWMGKPYRSKQVEIARLTAANGVEIQMLRFLGDNFNGGYIRNGVFPSDKILTKNDGLSLADWEEWFRGYDLSKPLAIIHFTTFRY